MAKSLKEIVKEIQYKTDWTLDQIADKAEYSRGYFRNEVSKNKSRSIRETLQAKFNDLIEQNDLSGMEFEGHAPTVIIEDAGARYLRLLEQTIQEKREIVKGLESTINGLIEKQEAFLSRMEKFFYDYDDGPEPGSEQTDRPKGTSPSKGKSRTPKKR